MATVNSVQAAQALAIPSDKVDEAEWGAPAYISQCRFAGAVSSGDSIRLIRFPTGARIHDIFLSSLASGGANQQANLKFGTTKDDDKFAGAANYNGVNKKVGLRGLDEIVDTADGWLMATLGGGEAGWVLEVKVWWSPGAT